MGALQTKGHNTKNGGDARIMRENMKLLQEKVDEMMWLRETERQAYEQDTMVYALKESEWKRERKWLRAEIRRLKKNNKFDDHDKLRDDDQEREEAAAKWKRLYLAIKIELDNLINTTTPGVKGCWREEGAECLMEDLQREVKALEDTIEVLQAHIASMEEEECRREREVDILRQSLRIMSHNNKKKHKHPNQKASF